MNNKHNWDKIYNENAPRLIGIIRRYVGDNSLAEDILHDSFITAIKKEKSYTGRGSIEGWTQKIAINTALQYLRKNKKERVALDNVMDYLENNNLKGDDNYSLKSKIEEFGFSMNDLLEAIDSLPIHHKSVFNLYVIEKYKHKQIGEMLGISPGTSKSHLARGRKKVQKILFELVKIKGEEEKRPFYALLFASTGNEWEKALDSVFQNKFNDFTIQPTNVFQVQNSITQLSKSSVTTKIFTPILIKTVTILSIASISIIALSVINNQKKMNPSFKNETTVNHDSIDSIPKQIDSIHISTPQQSLNSKTDDSAAIKTPVKKEIIVVRKKIIVRDTIYEYH